MAGIDPAPPAGAPVAPAGSPGASSPPGQPPSSPGVAGPAGQPPGGQPGPPPVVVPEWARSPATLDLQRLAQAFEALLRPDPRQAVAFWQAVAPVLAEPLRLAWGRIIDARLDLWDRAALVRCRQGHDFLFHRWVERARKPTAAPLPWASPSLVHDHYGSLVLCFGSPAARRAMLKGELVLLALRRESSTLANRGTGSYDDLIVVLNARGAPRRPRLIAACTEPGAQYAQRAAFKPAPAPAPAAARAPASGTAGTAANPHAITRLRVDARYAGISFRKADGADVNRDGIKDAGRLRAGTYQYFEKPGGFLGARAFRVRQTQQVERDTDGDGLFTPDDPQRLDPTGAGTSMYIHRGGAGNVAQPNTWSAGCQTIPGNLYRDFLAAVGHPKSFYYVLIDTVVA